MATQLNTQDFYVRISLIIVACTLLLTASFIGILSLISGEVAGVGDRIPWYLVVSAIGFVTAIVILEGHGASGQEIIATAIIVSVVLFILFALSVEGMIYATRFPEEVFVSQLVVYFLAAGLIGAGLGYWSLQHWREFTRDQQGL